MPGAPISRQAWFNFNRIDLLGTPDPAGGFPKPDSNILAPAGLGVSAPADGVVTGISNNFSDGFGNAVTVRFNKPPNPYATHFVFLHLTSLSPGLKVGQMVKAGDVLGWTGSNPQNASLGFALYPGNNYGKDSAWSAFDTVPNLTGNGVYNPVPYLDALKNGKVTNINPATGANTNTSLGGTMCAPWDIGCVWGQINGGVVSFGEHIAIFLIALLFIVLGFVFLMGGSQVGQTIGKVAKIGAMA